MRISSCLNLLVFLIPLFISNRLEAQKYPVGYVEQFNHKCNSDSFFGSFLPENPEAWKVETDKNFQCVKISGKVQDTISMYTESRGVFSGFVFGDFIIEFEFRNDAGNHALFTFLGPVKSANTYYSFRFSSDSINFQFLENNLIKTEKSQGAPRLKPGWNKCRVERDILGRKTYFILNGDIQRKVTFTDKSLVMGYVGFGSLGTSYLKNIVIYAPTAITDTSFKWF